MIETGAPIDTDRITLLQILRRMLLIRRFDEAALELRLSGEIYGAVHPYTGQEAVAAGVGQHLNSADKLVTYHRGHGHTIAKGASVDRMMAELFGRVDGFCKGKGGSMHIADFSVGMLGTNGIVGAGLPQATGAALAHQILGQKDVVVCFFGDGAMGQGLFHESMNLASLWSLPVVFVCDNNQYATATPIQLNLANPEIATYAANYRMPGERVDGTDVLAVYRSAGVAIARAKEGGGPTLLECVSYRFGVHSQRGVVQQDGRPQEEITAARDADPIEKLMAYLRDRGLATNAEFDELRRTTDAEIDHAVAFARSSPFPQPESALDDLFASGGDEHRG
jgi:acetoin:2,6-dichlorophenolindophenol oxidoreductase subunit alpha